jgi:hypothetical protein
MGELFEVAARAFHPLAASKPARGYNAVRVGKRRIGTAGHVEVAEWDGEGKG